MDARSELRRNAKREKRAIKQRIAGMTLPQQLRQWQSLGPHTHEILHDFGNGYTVRRAMTPKDAKAIGLQMRNCWRSVNENNFVDEGPNGRAYHAVFNEHGLPEIAFYHYTPTRHDGGEVVSNPLGHHNMPITPEQSRTMQAYADAMGARYFRPFHITPEGEERRYDNPPVQIPGTNITVTGSAYTCPYCNHPMKQMKAGDPTSWYCVSHGFIDLDGRDELNAYPWEVDSPALMMPEGWGYDGPVSDSPGRTAAGSPEDVAEGWSPPSGPIDYADGLGLGTKSETPSTFAMPPEIEQRFVAMMECPHCQGHLRYDRNRFDEPVGKYDPPIYCETCGWRPE